MILETQEHEIVNVLFNQFCALFVFDWPTAMLITRIEDALGHKDFYNVKKCWITI